VAGPPGDPVKEGTSPPRPYRASPVRRFRLEMTQLLVGRVVSVTDHPGARGPSLLVELDFGPRGAYEAQLEPGEHAKEDLPGKLLVASLDDGGGAIVLVARSHERGPVVVVPATEVEPGTVVA
jgi:hypothetical protein